MRQAQICARAKDVRISDGRKKARARRASWGRVASVVEWKVEPDAELADRAVYQRGALEGFMWAAFAVPNDSVEGLPVRSRKMADLVAID
jgi:hypothetical protein